MNQHAPQQRLARSAGATALFGALMLVFFLGGLARVVSWLAVGAPDPAFVALGALELLLPAVLWPLSARLPRQQ